MKKEDNDAESRSITDDNVDWVSFHHVKSGKLCGREITKLIIRKWDVDTEVRQKQGRNCFVQQTA